MHGLILSLRGAKPYPVILRSEALSCHSEERSPTLSF
jgi:hypothetical protein